MALVQPAAPVALGEEAPDQVVVLVAEREVAAAGVGHPEPPDEHLDGVGDRAVRALDRRDRRRVGAQQVAEPAQLVRVVPVHPHPEPDRLLGLARRVGQHALLAERHELGDPERLDVALGREPEVALDVDLDPQALAVEAVLVALVLAEHRVEALVEVLVGAAPGVVDAHRVVGRDRPVEEAPVRSAGVLGTQPGEGPPVAPQLEDLVLLGDEIGLRTDGSEHSASGSELGSVRGARPRVTAGRTRVPVSAGPGILPAMHEPEGARPRTRSPFAAAFLSLIFPGLGQLYAGAPMRALAFAAGPILAARARGRRWSCAIDRIALLGFVFDPGVLDRGLRPQPRRPGLPARRDRRRLPGRRVPQRAPAASGDGQRAGARVVAQPAVDRRPAGGRPGHGRQPRRRRPLRPARQGPPRQRLHLRRRRDARNATLDASPSPGATVTPTPGPDRPLPTDTPDPGGDPGRERRARRSRSRRGTARSGSTSCSSAPTSSPARRPTTPTR